MSGLLIGPLSRSFTVAVIGRYFGIVHYSCDARPLPAAGSGGCHRLVRLLVLGVVPVSFANPESGELCWQVIFNLVWRHPVGRCARLWVCTVVLVFVGLLLLLSSRLVSFRHACHTFGRT